MIECIPSENNNHTETNAKERLRVNETCGSDKKQVKGRHKRGINFNSFYSFFFCSTVEKKYHNDHELLRLGENLLFAHVKNFLRMTACWCYFCWNQGDCARFYCVKR